MEGFWKALAFQRGVCFLSFVKDASSFEFFVSPVVTKFYPPAVTCVRGQHK